MALALPTFMVLRYTDEHHWNEYLGIIHENGKLDGYLEFSETQAVSPYAKFEVEPATRADKAGLVHIRSCQNNKYWERTKNLSITENSKEQYWITATANKPEEDQSKESCTLFKPIFIDTVMNTAHIVHVQSECYLNLWRLSLKNPVPGDRCVLANYEYLNLSTNIFTVIDWESLMILPRYVTFKGNNGKYLNIRPGDLPFMNFVTDDIGNLTVPCEIFVTHDGNIRIKTIACNKFWRRSPNWIWADSDDESSNNKDTLFRPVKVDNQTIALLNLGNNRFCSRLTYDGNTDCLNATDLSVTKDAQLKVEEPVMTREIHNVKYKLDHSRVYDEKVLVVARNSASNYTQQSTTLDVKLSYTDAKTSTWKANFSLKLGVKATLDFKLPLIFEGKIELSGEVQSGVEWGKTMTSTTVMEDVHKVVVPPMTKVTVDLVATMGKCDVPFSFIQRDTLYNGNIVTTELHGGIYTGSNYYNIDFQTKEEKLQ
ncbi:hypothetical protein REPUB_Repub15cG0010900 [Reevesia pubescens]